MPVLLRPLVVWDVQVAVWHPARVIVIAGAKVHASMSVLEDVKLDAETHAKIHAFAQHINNT